MELSHDGLFKLSVCLLFGEHRFGMRTVGCLFSLVCFVDRQGCCGSSGCRIGCTYLIYTARFGLKRPFISAAAILQISCIKQRVFVVTCYLVVYIGSVH